jgi:hypothetical protein
MKDIIELEVIDHNYTYYEILLENGILPTPEEMIVFLLELPNN